MDTQQHVQIWPQVPHNTQKPHSHSFGKLSPDFPSLPIRIELQVLSVLSFFPPAFREKKKKKTAKVLVSTCPKAGRQDRMWENCHHLLPKYQPSSGAVQTARLGTARNHPRTSPCPWSNQLCWVWCQAKVLCSGKAFASPSSFP